MSSPKKVWLTTEHLVEIERMVGSFAADLAITLTYPNQTVILGNDLAEKIRELIEENELTKMMRRPD